MIIALDGLPFSGKSTTCKDLCDYYTAKGFSVANRSKGHLTNRGDKYMELSFEALEKWDFSDCKSICDYIDLGFASMSYDFDKYLNENRFHENIDIMIIDRLYTGHCITAEHFGRKYNQPQIPSGKIYEFILTCTYEEACRRLALRCDTHGKLTDYIMDNKQRYDSFQKLYEKHVNGKQSTIINNECFTATRYIIEAVACGELL